MKDNKPSSPVKQKPAQPSGHKTPIPPPSPGTRAALKQVQSEFGQALKNLAKR